MSAARPRPRREILWRLACGAAGLAVGAGLAGGAGVVLLRRLYLERADLRLDPAGLAYFAGANGELPAPAKPRLVFFGDSRVAQWTPPAELPQRELVFRGISGQSTAQMRFRFADDVIALAPKEVVIQAGINDLVAGLIAGRRSEAREQTLANLTALAQDARARGIAVLLTTIIRPARPGLTQDRLLFSSAELAADVAAVNDRLRTLSLAGVRIVDLDAQLSGTSPALPAQYATDLVHLTDAAYAVANDAVAAALDD